MFMASTFDHTGMFLSDYVFGEEFLLAQVQEEDYAKMGGEERLGIRD